MVDLRKKKKRKKENHVKRKLVLQSDGAYARLGFVQGMGRHIKNSVDQVPSGTDFKYRLN